MGTLRFDSTDLGLTEEFLSMAYTKMHIGGRDEHTRVQVSRDVMGSIDMDDLSIDYDMSHDASEPIGKVCLCQLRSGGVVRQYLPEGTEGTFGPGDMFMYAPHDRPYAGVIKSAHYELTMFDPRLLEQVADAPPGRRPAPIRLTGDRPVSRAAADQLRSTIAHLRVQAVADPGYRDAPLIVATASQLLAACVLNTFPHNALTEPTAVDDHDAHTATVRRAVAFIDAHAGEPITLADIAAAARTTGRSVQVAFRRHHGTSPMGYLRRVRLGSAHRDLQAADPATASVAAIAARWGFGSVVLFASSYRRQYGVLPSHTLRA
jgi:AraC-like DNA-binding protein